MKTQRSVQQLHSTPMKRVFLIASDCSRPFSYIKDRYACRPQPDGELPKDSSAVRFLYNIVEHTPAQDCIEWPRKADRHEVTEDKLKAQVRLNRSFLGYRD